MWMKVKKLMENAKIPTRAHDTDAGLDVYCVENEVIYPHNHKLIKTGISMSIPDGWVAVVKEKSGLATKKQITIGACVIDSGYRGELMIHLFNNSDYPATFIMGDKIAQLLIVPCWTGQPEEVENLDETPRGDGGFGSTDKIEKQLGEEFSKDFGEAVVKEMIDRSVGLGDIVNIGGVKPGELSYILGGKSRQMGNTELMVKNMDYHLSSELKTGTLRRKTDTPESKKFWDNVDRMVKQTENWPEWKKKYAGMTFDPKPRKAFTDEELTQIGADMCTQLGNEVAEIYRKAFTDFKPETRDDWK